MPAWNKGRPSKPGHYWLWLDEDEGLIVYGRVQAALNGPRTVSITASRIPLILGELEGVLWHASILPPPGTPYDCKHPAGEVHGDPDAPQVRCRHCGQPLGSLIEWQAVLRSYL